MLLGMVYYGFWIIRKCMHKDAHGSLWAVELLCRALAVHGPQACIDPSACMFATIEVERC